MVALASAEEDSEEQPHSRFAPWATVCLLLLLASIWLMVNLWICAPPMMAG